MTGKKLKKLTLSKAAVKIRLLRDVVKIILPPNIFKTGFTPTFLRELSIRWLSLCLQNKKAPTPPNG